MQVTLPRRRRFTRIDDDPAAAVIALLPEKLVEDRKGLRAIGAGNQEHLSERNITPRIRSPIDTKRFVVPRRGGNHAEAPVVIDITRAQTRARELAHQVSLLSGQRRS